MLGVVIFHSFPKALPGGFIGVDIFFVISGYLISGILHKGVREGDFSFRDFYARRVRRLFPSLITVMLMCLGYGYFVLLRDEYQQLGKHVAAGTLFIQNFVFWQESGYWDVASSLKPLLHLWSLAVEEQFYIIFPPLLLLFWKKSWPMVPLLWILLVVSLISNLVMSTQDRSSDFYLTSYRAWEFLGGSLLAWWHFGKSHAEEAPYCNVISLSGLLFLVLGMTLLHQGDPYPGWRAILPVAGTLLLIGAGRHAWLNRQFLSHPAILWMGLISYPLYLFHWPAISFVQIVREGHPSDTDVICGLGVAFVLTVATYYLLERPIRFSKSPVTVPLLVAAFILTGCSGLLIWIGVIPSSADPELGMVQRALADRNWGEGTKTLWTSDRILLNQCGGTGPQTLFFGDSNMQQYLPRIAKLLEDSHGPDKRGALFLTCGGVPPLPGVTAGTMGFQADAMIRKYRELLSSDPRIDRVVIAALWPHYFAPSCGVRMGDDRLTDPAGEMKALASLGLLIHELTEGGKQVTLILAAPYGEQLDPRLLCERGFFGAKKRLPAPWSREAFLAHDGWILSKIARIARENGAQVVDPVDFLCPDGDCLNETAEGPIRYHLSHLRPGFVREHVTFLDQTVEP